MGSGIERYAVPYVIGLAPALLVALTWSPSGNWTELKLIIRSYQAPIIAAELFTVVVAVREGLFKALLRWSWTRSALAAAIGLAAVAAATALLAPMQAIAMVLTGYWLIHALFALAVVYLCGRMFAVSDLVRAYMVGFAVVATQFLVFLHQIPEWAKFDWLSGVLAFSNIRHAGYYLAAVGGLSIGLMAVAERRWEWAWAFATASLAIAIAFWTGSRGAVLAVAAAITIALIIAPAMRSARGWGGGLASFIVAAALATQVPAAPHPSLGITRTVKATASGNVTSGRTLVWKNALSAIQKRPFFGYGEGQMSKVAPSNRLAQPHNAFLQVALAWGLVGLLSVLTLAIAYAWRAIPAVRSEGGILVPPAVAISSIAILSLSDGSLYYALPTSMFFACAAVIVTRWRPS